MRSSFLAYRARIVHNARTERGDLNVLFVFVFILLVVFLALAVDVTLVLSKKAANDSLLQNVREDSVGTSMRLEAENSSDPDEVVARGVAESVRDAGFKGAVAVYFYEVPETDVAADRRDTERLYAYQVVVDDTVSPVFAALFGVAEIRVPSTFVATSNPRSPIKIWRPDGSKSAVWKLSPGAPAGSMASTAAALSTMPSGIQNAVARLSAS